MPQIRRLLATTDSLDSFIEIELDSGSDEPARIRVGRYLVELSRDQVSNSVSIPDEAVRDLGGLDISKLSAKAIRLDSLNDEPLALNRSAFNSQACWIFPADSLPNAPWLIYPSKDSPLLFRPVLWSTGCPETYEPLPDSRTLAHIAKISDPHERFEALQTTVENLAVNFDEPDWAVLEQFAEELSHLPLSTLDVWRAFSHSAIGMCAIALRTGGFPSSFFERFSSEMPSVWETIPLQIWVKCMSAYVQHIEKHPGLVSSLQNRIESIASIHPSLRALMEVAESLATGQPTDDVRLARTGQIKFHQILFSGETSPYQMLLRDRADADWPTNLRTEIHRAQSSSARGFMRLSEPPFREAVVNLPILLAVNVATGAEQDWSDPNRLRTLRKYQDFCPEWFSEAFDLTVARCVSEGLVDGLRR